MRTKKKVIHVPCRAEMESLVSEFRTDTLRLLQAQLNKERMIKEIDERYAAEIEPLTKATAEKFEKIQAWADANKPEFGVAKTLVLTHGKIGWRIGQPALKTLPGWTFDRVLEKLKSAAVYAGWIRTKQEVDKQAIIAARADLLDDDLKQIGLRVIQDESFYVEPKLDQIPT